MRSDQLARNRSAQTPTTEAEVLRWAVGFATQLDKRVVWWFSFHDPDELPENSFVGVTIVDGTEFADLNDSDEWLLLLDRLRALRANPGGETQCFLLSDEELAVIPERFLERLLNREEVDEILKLGDLDHLMLRPRRDC
ncbi:hypothetical protein [Caballeronia arvi]|uniref:hypothetical protein n=1 Tax=Caballeronia arvi TaxID=1777135 RepID=UPI001180C85E|nr:hypothetical protein [Caballeronia arvi]